jgi:hypothetical protein
MKFRLRSWSMTLLVVSVLAPLTIVSAQAPKAPKQQSVQLNIVFHGLFSYVIWSDHVEVLAPQVDEHVYKAGTWGKELRLKESATYQLSGVHAETVPPKVDFRNNLVLENVSNIDRGPDKLFFSFNLPLPKEILGLRLAHPDAKRPAFSGTAISNGALEGLPLVQVLVYEVDNLDALSLGANFHWIPEIIGNNAVNLHVWAEPEIEMAGDGQSTHASQAFSHLMALFPGVDLHLVFSTAAPPDKNTAVRGLNGWEENALVERQQLLFPSQTGKQQRHRGTEVSNCIGVIILNGQP